MNSIASFGMALTDRLAEAVSDGRVCDPKTGTPAPKSHYAEACFSVAALRVAAERGDSELHDCGVEALTTHLSRARDVRGHGEFTSFALLELLSDVRAGVYKIPYTAEQLVSQIEFESGLSTGHGNNWLLLQLLCRMKYAEMVEDTLSAQIHRKALAQLAVHWQSADGIFQDQPRVPIEEKETPLTYHSKMTYLAARLGEYNPEWTARTKLGLWALSNATLPTGEAHYFGRSENTLFGYACALASISTICSTVECPPWMETLWERLKKYLRESFNPTSANAVPARCGAPGVPVDGYVFDTVYAAYAAMLLVGIQKPDRNSTEKSEFEKKPRSFEVIVGSEGCMGLAPVGQTKYTLSRPDPRYAGMVPLALSYESCPILPGVPADAWNWASLPFLPTVVIDEKPYSPIRWDSIVERDTETVALFGTGRFTQLPATTGRPDSYSEEDTSVPAWKRLSRRLFLHIGKDWYKKQAAQISASVSRSIFYRKDCDVLAMLTSTEMNEGRVIPSSGLISENYTESLTIEHSQCVSKEESDIRGHHGPGTSILFSETNTPFKSVFVIDPGNNVDTVNTTFTNGFSTRIRLKNESETLVFEHSNNF